MIEILLISRHIHRYILRSVSEIDAVRSEMVDEVLQHVHLVGGDVVEGDGDVTAACETLLLRVELVRPIPAVVGNEAGDEVVLGDEGEEPLPALGVPGVSRLNSQVLHTLPHLNILGPSSVLTTQLWILEAGLHKSLQSLLRQDVACSSTEVSLLCEGFESPTKEYWFVRVKILG